jgi:hypothetical protein
MDMNLARSAKSAIQASGSDIHVVENFPSSMQVLRDGLKKVWKRDFETPHQGLNFMSEGTMTQPTENYQTFRSIGGIVGQNRDADDMEFVTRADGFGFEVNSYSYRQGIKVERELMEIDNVGVVRGLQMDLAENAKMTLEYAIADAFNRSVYTTGTDRFPLLADDGHPLIDDGRPNANPNAGTWGNKESDSAITPTSLWTAQLNARATTDENGELFPRKIMKLIIRPADEKTVEEIMKSDKNPLNANNTYNTMYNKFEWEVYDYLTAARIFYVMENPKSERNELRFYWRQKPNFLTWQGDNPDVIQQRVRFIFGLGLGSPRRVWRGGVVV